MRGNIAFRTAVEIFLIAFALAILIAFIWRNVSPGTSKTKLTQERIMLCEQYVRYDSNCNGIVDSTEGASNEQMSDSVFDKLGDLNNVCSQLGTPDIKMCCSEFCSD
jgi:hypothetical protein